MPRTVRTFYPPKKKKKKTKKTKKTKKQQQKQKLNFWVEKKKNTVIT